MSDILVRINHPGGLLRINANLQETFEDFTKRVGSKISIEPENIIMSFDGKRYMRMTTKKKLKHSREMHDGVKIFIKPLKSKKQFKKIREKNDPFLNKYNSKCSHGPNGKCLNCMEEDKKDKKSDGIDIVKEKQAKGKCLHGPNGRCINCINDEKKDEETYVKEKKKKRCDHGSNAKCLNCVANDLENIKHLSFDEYIDRNYAKCKAHRPDQKCNNCLVDLEFDYKIKKCLNHEPFPKGMCSKCLPPLIRMKRQKYRHVDYAQFMNFVETGKLIQYWLKNINQRVAIVYGYYAEDNLYPKGVRAVIEALYEPPQENSFNSTLLLNDPFQQNVDSLMVSLGLERIGWLFATQNRDTFLSSEEIMRAGALQEQHKVQHPVGIDVSKQITIVLRSDYKNNNQVTPEVYMVSDECQSLIRDNLVEVKDSRKYLHIKKPKDSRFQTKFLQKGKMVDNVETDFFIVNIAHGYPKDNKFTILNDNGFLPANRKDKQKPSMVRDYLRKHKGQKSYQKYANFHLLLYLSKMIDIHTVIAICECVRDQREVPDYLEMLIENYSNA